MRATHDSFCHYTPKLKNLPDREPVQPLSPIKSPSKRKPRSRFYYRNPARFEENLHSYEGNRFIKNDEL